MKNPNKGKKQLSKVLAVVMSAASLLGITAVPSMAVENEWAIEIFVSNDDPCVGLQDGALSETTAATWSPDPEVTYNNTQTATVFRGEIKKGISVTLGWEAGTSTACRDGASSSTVVAHTGTLRSAFESPDDLTFSAIQCFVTVCSAPDNFQYDASTISGQITVPSTATVGRKTGTLTVTWTP